MIGCKYRYASDSLLKSKSVQQPFSFEVGENRIAHSNIFMSGNVHEMVRIPFAIFHVSTN
jgi:hypothetical protein